MKTNLHFSAIVAAALFAGVVACNHENDNRGTTPATNGDTTTNGDSTTPSNSTGGTPGGSSTDTTDQNSPAPTNPPPPTSANGGSGGRGGGSGGTRMRSAADVNLIALSVEPLGNSGRNGTGGTH
jgi:hypothetical protein